MTNEELKQISETYPDVEAFLKKNCIEDAGHPFIHYFVELRSNKLENYNYEQLEQILVDYNEVMDFEVDEFLDLVKAEGYND